MTSSEVPVDITPTQQIIASCSGALLTSILVTPLDVVKVRLQSQMTGHAKHKFFVYHNGLMDHLCSIDCAICKENGVGPMASKFRRGPGAWFARPSHFTGTATCNMVAAVARQMHSYHFTGTVDAFVKIARFEGTSSLYSGLPQTLVMAIPQTVIYFTSYDQLKYYMGYREGDPSTKYIPIMAGISARMIATTLINPLELIRTKMQSEQLGYRALGEAVRTAIKDEGPAALMRGLGPSLLRDVPFSGVYWFCYEMFKRIQTGGLVDPTLSQSFTSGAMSGCICSLITMPFDVVKTKRQIALGDANFSPARAETTWHIVCRLYRERGVGALYAGTLPRTIRITLACSIMISSYESIKHFFRQRNAQRTEVGY